jgi:hypothetical protein
VSISLIPCRASGYGDAVDVERAADLYAQCRTLGEVGAELGVHWSTVSQQLQSAGIAMRSGTPPAHPASTKQILELRDQGLTDTERTHNATFPRTAKQMSFTDDEPVSSTGQPSF